ncbi:MAG: hypothetical protein OHK0046_45010 [Anaerolineae bacterium]
MSDLHDTKPRSPFQEPLDAQGPLLNEPRRGGCLLWGLILGFALGFAVLIVLLAGTAGYTEGQRIADRNATATQADRIGQQIVRIPTDIAEGNGLNLNRRLNYLETVAPRLNNLPALRETATALAILNQPTATLTPTPTPSPTMTPEMTEMVAEVTEEATSSTTRITGAGLSLDLVALLQEARDHIAAADYEAAQESLDIIIRADDQFQRETVRALMYDVLTIQARSLYNTTGTLAEAIRLTDLAEEYGSLSQSPLNYERLLAGLFLDAQRAVGAGDHSRAIQALRTITTQYQTTYKDIDLNRMLFDEYVAYAQAWELGGQPCQAVPQYTNALTLFNSAQVSSQRDNAQALCLQGTPVPGAEGAATIAPVGQQ